MKNNSARGYSLVGLIVAVAIGTMVCLGAAYVLTRSQYTSNFASMQSELDRLHYLNLQKARNLAYIRKQLGLADNVDLQNCFAQQKSTKCVSFGSTPKTVPPDDTVKQGLDKNLESEITLTSNCPTDTCTQLKVTVNTEYNTPPVSSGTTNVASYTPRRTVVYYPAFVLVPPSGIDYSCAYSQIMTGVSPGDLTAICQPVSGNLTGNNPLSNFGDPSPTPSTQPPVNTACAPGQFVSQAGIFAGQTVCQTITAVAVPPPTLPPPTTMPPVPPKTGACTPATDPNCIETTVRECFLAGTPVLMADGSQKAIEKIEEGDRVLAYDEISGERIETPVTATLHHEAKLQQLYHFVMQDGSNFTSNGVHLIYVPALSGYFSAAQIFGLWNQSHSLSLLGKEGVSVTIEKMDVYSDVVPMYNLHVEGVSQASAHDLGRGHNYFVDGILVHNSKCIEEDPVNGGCTAFYGGVSQIHGAITIWEATCYPADLKFISNFNIPYNGNIGRGVEDAYLMSSSQCQTLPTCGGSCGTPMSGGYCVFQKNIDKVNKNKPGAYCGVTEAQCICPDNTLGGFFHY